MERLKKQRRAARRQRAAARRAAEARKREAARRDARARRLRRTARESGGVNETLGAAVPILATTTIAALLIFGLALVPAYAVPWHRMSIALEVHREQFAVVGAMTLLAAAAVFLSLTFLGH
jgi:uncharacterized membrane protein YdbT with pleckstrin-like domain